MSLIAAAAAFIISLFLEMIFLPRIFGIFLPVSFWFAVMAFVMLDRRHVPALALFASFVKMFFVPSVGAFFTALFLLSALFVILIRRLLSEGWFAADAAVIALTLLFFEIFSPLISGLLVADEFRPAGAYFFAAPPKDILAGVLFLLFAGLILYLNAIRRLGRQSLYVK